LEGGRQLRPQLSWHAHDLVETQLVDFGGVVRRERVDLSLSERHLGAADVDDGPRADLELSIHELELPGGGLYERIEGGGGGFTGRWGDVRLRHAGAQDFGSALDVRFGRGAVRLCRARRVPNRSRDIVAQAEGVG